MRALLESFEASFLKLAEVQHKLECDEGPLDKFLGIINISCKRLQERISQTSCFQCFSRPCFFEPMSLYLYYFGCPALQYWSLHVPHVPTRILEEVNLAKAAARDPHLDHCEGHLFGFSFYVFRLLMIPYYFSDHHLMVVFTISAYLKPLDHHVGQPIG